MFHVHLKKNQAGKDMINYLTIEKWLITTDLNYTVAKIDSLFYTYPKHF